MKKIIYTLTIGSILILLSCQKSEILPFIEEIKESSSFQSFPEFSNAIQLDNPKVGQRNKYIKWISEDGYVDSPTIVYQTEDTVTLEVVKKIEDYIGDDGTSRGDYALNATHIYKLKESYNKEPDLEVNYWLFVYGQRKVAFYTSYDLNDQSSPYPKLLSAPHTEWRSSNRDGLIEGVVELPLSPLGGRIVNLNGFVPDFGTSGSVWNGTMERYEQRGDVYEFPNIRRDNRSENADGFLLIYWYFRNIGPIRLSSSSYWSKKFEGWDIIVE